MTTHCDNQAAKKQARRCERNVACGKWANVRSFGVSKDGTLIRRKRGAGKTKLRRVKYLRFALLRIATAGRQESAIS